MSKDNEIFELDENGVTREPMTFEELRGRLKHIAGLCYGLSIDLANEIELREKLQKENAALRAANKGLVVKASTERTRRKRAEKRRCAE